MASLAMTRLYQLSWGSKFYAQLYDTYETPGTLIHSVRSDSIHHGLVLISDGKGSGKPGRLELTRDALAVQVPLAVGAAAAGEMEEVAEAGLRRVTLKRDAEEGLGLSIKGGKDPHSPARIPVLVSKLFKRGPAAESGALFVGDSIVEVNGYSVEGKSHEEVVKLLKEAGEEVVLSVRHYVQMAPYLRSGGSLRRDQSGSAMERLSEMGMGTWRSSTQRMANAGSDLDTRSVGESSVGDGAPEGWKLLAKIPLPMAFLSRYLWGTDKLRNNAFEVRAVDGTSSGIVHCEDAPVLTQWVKYIAANIAQLNNKSIKMSNKFLHPSELIVYLGWVSERVEGGVEGELGQAWEPRFLILKGQDVCVFQSPPLNSEDLNRCIYSQPVYETAFRAAKEEERADGREWAFWLETGEAAGSPGRRHYLSVESAEALAQVEAAWHRAVYLAVSRLTTKTFACNFQGRPSGLQLHLHNGFSLYDIPSKRYHWQRKFSQLKSSSDDGKMRLQLVFHSAKEGQDDVKDLDCAELYPLLYSVHAFLVTRLISLDPDYLKAPWK